MYLNLLPGKAQISVPQTNLSVLTLQLSVGIWRSSGLWNMGRSDRYYMTAWPTRIFPMYTNSSINLMENWCSLNSSYSFGWICKCIFKWYRSNLRHWITISWRIACQSEKSVLCVMWTRNTFLLCEDIATLEFIVIAANITLTNVYYKTQCPCGR